jgi:hypothetical protein
MARVLIANCLMAIQESASAFVCLRQAISLLEIFRIHDRTSIARFSRAERLKLERLYHLLYVHERYQAISEFRRPILEPLSAVSECDPDVPAEIHVGFTQIIKLFHLLDAEFLRLWLNESDTSAANTAWIQHKGAEFQRDKEAAEEENRVLSAPQRADLSITRCWLLSLLWRLAMTYDLLSSLPQETCLSILFPLNITAQLRQNLQPLPVNAIMSNGVGITQKLFEVADTAADLLLYAHPTLGSFTDELYDNLVYLQALIANNKLGEMFQSILEGKSRRILQQREHTST